MNIQDWCAAILASPSAILRATHDISVTHEKHLGPRWESAAVTFRFEPADEFDANVFLRGFALEMQKRLQGAGAEVAHLKMTFSPNAGLGDIAVVNLVRSDFVPELAIRLEQPAGSGQVIVNLRAEADPELLSSVLREALPVASAEVSGLETALEHLEFFKPGKPVPTHRLESEG